MSSLKQDKMNAAAEAAKQASLDVYRGWLEKHPNVW